MNLNIFVDAFEEINNKMKAMNETLSQKMRNVKGMSSF